MTAILVGGGSPGRELALLIRTVHRLGCLFAGEDAWLGRNGSGRIAGK